MTATWNGTPQQVEQLVAAVLPHTMDDRHIPAISCVQLEIDGVRVTAAATDRYTLAVARAELTDWAEDAASQQAVSTCLYAADLRRLFTFLRPRKKDTATWELTGRGLTVVVGEESLTIRAVEVNFPDWRALVRGITGRPAATGTPRMAFLPGNLDKFIRSAKVLGADVTTPLRWHFGSTHTDAPVISIGEHFLGVLMPVRVADDAPPLDLEAFGLSAPAVTA